MLNSIVDFWTDKTKENRACIKKRKRKLKELGYDHDRIRDIVHPLVQKVMEVPPSVSNNLQIKTLKYMVQLDDENRDEEVLVTQSV